MTGPSRPGRTEESNCSPRPAHRWLADKSYLCQVIEPQTTQPLLPADSLRRAQRSPAAETVERPRSRGPRRDNPSRSAANAETLPEPGADHQDVIVSAVRPVAVVPAPTPAQLGATRGRSRRHPLAVTFAREPMSPDVGVLIAGRARRNDRRSCSARRQQHAVHTRHEPGGRHQTAPGRRRGP